MTDLPISSFTAIGLVCNWSLMAVACALAASSLANLARPLPVLEKTATALLLAGNILFGLGFLWICWFHYQIYLHLPLELPETIALWLNRQLDAMNSQAAYGLPLYDTANPPRYAIPVWIENEKYFFWFLCYGLMALLAHFRTRNPRLRAALHLLFAVQTVILVLFLSPFREPLPRFFAEIAPWFSGELPPMALPGLFMKLYPKQIFYYNASYMWLHPPMLFISYACITITFVTSLFMLVRRDPDLEKMGYDFAKLGYFMLTLGMLLGYPWALQAWGPNWWWDPKICSSIMMWAIYSTYLHTRLYANKPGMWYFSSALGIICFLAMVFTFLASFFFPGEHTFQ